MSEEFDSIHIKRHQAEQERSQVKADAVETDEATDLDLPVQSSVRQVPAATGLLSSANLGGRGVDVSRAAYVQRMQQTHGNQYVQQMIQRSTEMPQEEEEEEVPTQRTIQRATEGLPSEEEEEEENVAQRTIQRSTEMPQEEEEEELPTQRTIQRTAANEGQPEQEDNTIAQRIQAKAGSGNNLDPAAKGHLENSLGADLSGVKVHTDGEADHLARSVDAVAFTTGQEIFFRSGTYNPNSQQGMHLLAHEVTHTVQQANGPVSGTAGPGGVAVSHPSDSFEQAADQTATNVTAVREDKGNETKREENKPVSQSGYIRNSSANIQRKVSGTNSNSLNIQRAKNESNGPSINQLKARDDAHIILDIFRGKVMAHLDECDKAARNIGSAYAMAADLHQKAVNDSGKQKALEDAVFFGVLSTLAAGGVSWVCDSAVSPILVHGLEDAIQTGADKIFDVRKQQNQNNQPDPINKNPLVYQNQQLNRVVDSRKNAEEIFQLSFEGLLNTPLESFDNFNKENFQSVLNSWFTQFQELKGASSLPSTEAMTKEIERGFWAQWIPSSLNDGYFGDRAGGVHKKYKSPGSAVEKRFDALGITAEAGVKDFGWWTSDTEINLIISWAEGYKPVPFSV